MKITVTTDKGKIEISTEAKFNFAVDYKIVAISLIKASIEELNKLENE